MGEGQCCGNCAHFTGQTFPKRSGWKHAAGRCGWPVPQIALADTLHSLRRELESPHRMAAWPEEGRTCPCWQPRAPRNTTMENNTVEQSEAVAKAKDALARVPMFWHRMNDWTSGRTPEKPYEVCRYGRDDAEDEIVVVHACASQAEADEMQRDAILEARAVAVLEASQAPLLARIETLEAALEEIAEATAKRQLPLTTQVNDIARNALAPPPSE